MTLNVLLGRLNEHVESGEQGPFELSLTLAQAAALAVEISTYVGTSGDRPTLEANAGEKSLVDTLSESRDWLFGAASSLSVIGRNVNSREVSLAATNAEQAGLWLNRALDRGVG